MDMIGSPGPRTLAAAVMAAAMVLGGCTSEGATTQRPTQPAVTVGAQTTAVTTASTSAPATSGDLDASHGITLTLAPGWVISSVTDEDDGRLHTLDHAATGGQLLLVTTGVVADETPATFCVGAQDELGDRYQRNGAVTRTQGASHSDNAHTCGLAATNDDGAAIEITIFAAVGTRAAFVSAALFPADTPQGVSQESFDQAVREASQMSSELLNDID